ncbi:MAG: UbiX family flavin prenyltransferase [Nitrospirae bacterium]|nr:UbiX family flavin prenyltransferase [Nitrospirota bacterium]
MEKKRYVVAITGTTGVEIGFRLLSVLLPKAEVHTIVSDTAIEIARHEVALHSGDGLKKAIIHLINKRFNTIFDETNLYVYDNSNLWAPISSGSFITDGMFIVPCSMKTLAAVSCGYAEGLIERAADVTIKEGRVLVLCPRETPFSAIHLENMLKLARLGVRIVPPTISTYHGREDLNGMIDFIVGKLLDQIGLQNDLYKRWKSKTLK